jgi:oligopeptide/dipeptide ABC transporter ATP-binding protein
VSVQATILNLLADLQERLRLALIFVSHDLRVVRYVTRRVLVMYAGRIVEASPVPEIFLAPEHPYTRGLLASVPSQAKRGKERPAISGEIPGPLSLPSGCHYRTRCPIGRGVCAEIEPELRAGQTPTHAAACHFAWPDSTHGEPGSGSTSSSQLHKQGGA